VNSTPARIAYVVFNDTYRDSRVLKTLDSAAARGHAARVFAIGGPLSQFEAGLERRESGGEILRLAIFPDRWRAARAVARRVQAGGTAPMPGAAPGPAPTTAPEGSAGAAAPPRRADARTRILALAGRTRTWASRSVSRVVTSAANTVRRMSFERRATAAVLAWKPDLVHAHDANTLRVALAVQRRAGVPFVYDAHELWEERNARRGRYTRWAERRLLELASRRMGGSVTVSPGIRDWMTDRYGLADPPILVRNIPLSDGEPPSRASGRLRDLAGLGPDAKVIVYVGRITTGRGIDQTLEAVAAVPEVHFVLLGYGPDAFLASVAARAAALGISDRVHLVGSVESAEVSRTIADADASIVFTQPLNLSYRFSLPNKLFESIHAGQAIIASDLPDVSALVDEYGVGVTFPHDDVAELARRIREVIAAPDGYRERARRAAAELTWDGEMDTLFGLYDRVRAGGAT